MDKQWIEEKEREYEEKKRVLSDQIRQFIEDCPIFEKMWKNVLYAKMDRAEDTHNEHCTLAAVNFKDDMDLNSCMYQTHYEDGIDVTSELINEWTQKMQSIDINEYTRIICETYYLHRYEDSIVMEFDGDIVITDPCYMIKEKLGDEYIKNIPKKENFLTFKSIKDYPDAVEIINDFWESKIYEQELEVWEKAVANYEKTNDDWAKCNYGSNMEVLGIKKYMTRDTIYGDWGCTVSTIDDDENIVEDIGCFCADAGLVTVADLSEVLSYNPDFNKWVEKHSHCATIIRNFKGNVRFLVSEEVYEEDDVKDTFYAVKVFGDGIIKDTNEPIKFISYQGEL